MLTVSQEPELQTDTSAESLRLPEKTREKQTYGQILKSSAVVGGSSVLNIGIGIVRTKAMALLLGPGGVGLAGLYTSITTVAQSVAGMGVNNSGVRQIAEAVGKDDKESIGRTVAVLRRTSVALGALGALALICLSPLVSKLTFGTTAHTGMVCLLALSLMLQLISVGQGALLQGMRRIGDLARMNVIGALTGTIVGIPVVYFFREKGIVPSLICVSAMAVLTSWWYSRKIKVFIPGISVKEFRYEVGALLKLGVAFMLSGLLVGGVAYITRIILSRHVGIVATGLYQSAWMLGGLYVNVILQAMGADFYPRLSAVGKDNQECNRMVNEQALIGLLLAGPGVIATLTFAPVVIAAFYSAKFAAAVGVLRWVSLGATLQVITWPMGFIILAKARQDFFILSEGIWALMAVGLSWFFITRFGLAGAGIAFFISYILHAALVYPIVRRLSGFHWSSTNKNVGTLFLLLIAATFAQVMLFPSMIAFAVGLVMTMLAMIFSVRLLMKLVPTEDVPRPIRRLLSLFAPRPSSRLAVETE